MRTPYDDLFDVGMLSDGESATIQQQQQQRFGNNYNNNKNSAIPYHARENSLPFSYGPISKTSTPLRSVAAGAGASERRNYGETSSDFDFDYNNSISKQNYLYNNGRALKTEYASDGGGGGGGQTTTIKAQPRLTSPLLVRKTLNVAGSGGGSGSGSDHKSPTRFANTNTIANTYHFSSNNSNNNNSNGHGLNGFSHQHHNHHNGHSSRNNGTLRKTPIRSEFEESLRECREKVLNEYRTPVAESTSVTRQNRGQNHKYNYDFEFNLNLNDDNDDNNNNVDNFIRHRDIDEVDKSVPMPPRRAYTMERISSLQQQQQQQQQQYRKRDIPMAYEKSINDIYGSERYHTISSSNAYREQRGVDHKRPPLEVAYNRRYLQSSNSNTTAYGNGNASGYGGDAGGVGGGIGGGGHNNGYGNGSIASNSYSEYATSIQQQQQQQQRGTLGGGYATDGERARNRSIEYTTQTQSQSHSPIYAISTKQQQQQQQQQQHNSNAIYRTVTKATTTTPTEPESSSSIMDYHHRSTSTSKTISGGGMASPSSLASRPETPAFPVTPRTPSYGTQNGRVTPIGYPYSPPASHSTSANGHLPEMHNYNAETIYQTATINNRPRLNSSLSNRSEPQEVAPHLVKFAKDSSQFWYKPNMSRDEAIALLLNATPGTFIVRDSTTYKNAFGLVVRVAQPPPGSEANKPDELVRHYLIEPTSRGVRLKGCANEPVFTSLSALIYEHSVNQLALSCLLRIPEEDLVPPRVEPTPAQKQLMTQGAACNVLWLFSCDTESLTGEEAIRRAVRQLFAQKPLPTPIEVHFKALQQGITLTDSKRVKFFRQHYSADSISFCAIDPDHHTWTGVPESVGSLKKAIFAFVARRSPSSKDNQCHVFCELAINQPATAIVSYVNKVMPTEKQRNVLL